MLVIAFHVPMGFLAIWVPDTNKIVLSCEADEERLISLRRMGLLHRNQLKGSYPLSLNNRNIFQLLTDRLNFPQRLVARVLLDPINIFGFHC